MNDPTPLPSEMSDLELVTVYQEISGRVSMYSSDVQIEMMFKLKDELLRRLGVNNIEIIPKVNIGSMAHELMRITGFPLSDYIMANSIESVLREKICPIITAKDIEIKKLVELLEEVIPDTQYWDGHTGEIRDTERTRKIKDVLGKYQKEEIKS